MTQYLTGHGNFATYLYRFGKRGSPLCVACGVDDSPGHVLYDCHKYQQQRVELAGELIEKGYRFDIKFAVREKAGFGVVARWIKVIGRLREAENI